MSVIHLDLETLPPPSAYTREVLTLLHLAGAEPGEPAVVRGLPRRQPRLGPAASAEELQAEAMTDLLLFFLEAGAIDEGPGWHRVDWTPLVWAAGVFAARNGERERASEAFVRIARWGRDEERGLRAWTCVLDLHTGLGEGLPEVARARAWVEEHPAVRETESWAPFVEQLRETVVAAAAWSELEARRGSPGARAEADRRWELVFSELGPEQPDGGFGP